MQKIFFHSADRSFRFSSKTILKAFIATIFTKEKRKLKCLRYIFCSDEYLLNINKTFLQHDYYTDIITFDLSESDSIEGEIYISLDRIKENATLQKAKISDESLRVVFHGVLHLCGYKDKSKKDILEMRSKEDYYLALFHKNKPVR